MCLSLCERPVTVRLHMCMHTATWCMHRHAGRHGADKLAAAAMLHACVCLRFMQPAPAVGPLQLSGLLQSWFQTSCFMTSSAAVGTQGLPARTEARLPCVITVHKGRATFNNKFFEPTTVCNPYGCPAGTLSAQLLPRLLQEVDLPGQEDVPLLPSALPQQVCPEPQVRYLS